MRRTRVAFFTMTLVPAVLLLTSCQKAPKDRDVRPPSNAGKVELVELSAAWNPACRMQGPVVDALAKEYEGRAKITRIDVEADPEAADRYGVKSGPPALVLLVGGEVFRRLAGLQSADEIRAALDEALGAR